MIFESKWKQFLLLENIEEVYQKIVKKNPERKQIWDRFKAGIEQKVRSPILAGQYLQWAFTQIANSQKYNEIVVDGNMSKEDMIMEAINLFEDNKGRISGSKSILDYDWNGVRTALGNIESSKREKKKQIKDTGADVLYESKLVKVYLIKSKEASCLLGKGTQWCTAATTSDNMFESYNGKNYIVIIISTQNNDVKYQFAISRETEKIVESRNSKDDTINLKEIMRVFGVNETFQILNSIPFLKEKPTSPEEVLQIPEREQAAENISIQMHEWFKGIIENGEYGDSIRFDSDYSIRFTGFWGTTVGFSFWVQWRSDNASNNTNRLVAFGERILGIKNIYNYFFIKHIISQTNKIPYFTVSSTAVSGLVQVSFQIDLSKPILSLSEIIQNCRTVLSEIMKPYDISKPIIELLKNKKAIELRGYSDALRKSKLAALKQIANVGWKNREEGITVANFIDDLANPLKQKDEDELSVLQQLPEEEEFLKMNCYDLYHALMFLLIESQSGMHYNRMIKLDESIISKKIIIKIKTS